MSAPTSHRTPTSFRFSQHTTRQIKELVKSLGIERTGVMNLAIDRLWIQTFGAAVVKRQEAQDAADTLKYE